MRALSPDQAEFTMGQTLENAFPANGPATITLKALSFRFGAHIVLSGIDLDIAPSEFLVVLGPSGCGKSTLLRLLAGLIRPSSGTVQHHPRAPEIGFVFQEASLIPWRTSLENVTLPLEIRGQDPTQARLKAQGLLESMGLSGFERHYPSALSGGMRMRVSIARALADAPGLLLLDEPFGALDERTRRRLDDHLRQLTRALSITTVMVTHSIEEAVRIADRIVVLGKNPGRLLVERRLPENLSAQDRHRWQQELTEALDGAEASDSPAGARSC